MKSMMKKAVSMALSVALIGGCVSVSHPEATEASAASASDTTTQFAEVSEAEGTEITVGDVLLSEDFSKMNVGDGLPEGWTNYNADWLYKSGSNTVSVKEISGKKHLEIADGDGATAIVFPSLGTTDYTITANVYLNQEKITAGFVTNITDPMENSGKDNGTAVTYSYYWAGGSGSGYGYVHHRVGTKDITPYPVEVTHERLTAGSTVKLTVCSYKGNTYLYINDTYMGSLSYMGTSQSKNLCGIYLCGGTISLRDVTISELVGDTTTDIRSEVEVLDNLVDEDFSTVTGSELPEGWTLITENKSWGWGLSNGKTEKKDGGLQFSSTTDGVLTAPSLGTSDYVMTAQIQCKSNRAYLGLLSNIIDPVSQAVGMTKSYINTDAGTIVQENRENGTAYDTQSMPITKILSSTPGNGTELTLTIYSYRGNTYFYIGDALVGEVQQRSPQAEKSLCGLYVCASTMLIKHVKIDAIAKVGDISKKLYATETLLAEDFSGVVTGGLPEKWQELEGKWLWNATNENPDTVEVQEGSDNKKYLQIADWDGEVQLILPALGVADYVMSMELKADSMAGSVGLLTNMTEPISAARGATHSLLYLSQKNDMISQYYKNANKAVINKQDTSAAQVLGTWPKLGEIIKLTVYSYQGYTYFYVNDIFAQKIEQNSAELESSLCGLYFCGTSVKIQSVTVQQVEKRGETSSLKMLGAAVRYADADGQTRGQGSSGMRFAASLDKDSFLYKEASSANIEVQVGMVIAPAAGLELGIEITVDTEGAMNFETPDIYQQDDKTMECSVTLLGLTELDDYYAARAYLKVGREYYYSNQIKRSQSRLATRLCSDEKLITDDIKNRLSIIFEGATAYLPADEVKTLNFTVVGDLHYKEGMYVSSVDDLETILKRAEDNNSGFVLHVGDFCNDYIGSPELTNTYMNSDLPTYGIYGNHELESANNSMAVVTPLLTNQKDNVVWGTTDGNIGDGSIGYYYFDDASGFRIVCTDSNYSWNESKQEWQHNTTASWGNPDGNIKANSLGAAQLVWLENVLTDAAQSQTPCIVVSHAPLSGAWGPSPDSESVQAIFNKVNAIQKGTVLLALNGHNHKDHMKIVDDVVYIDVNTVRNGHWDANAEAHYTDEHTFEYKKYDSAGNLSSTETAPLSTLSQSSQSWFFTDPLSANIRISTAGYIEVDGWDTTWMHGVVPDLTEGYCAVPRISDQKINFLY